MYTAGHKNRKYLIVGDIHGCYYTFCRMLELWDSNNEYLIDRSHYSSLVLHRCMELSRNFTHALFLKGKHGAEFITHVSSGYNKKMQVHGHTPLKGGPAAYQAASDSWNIDTAAQLMVLVLPA